MEKEVNGNEQVKRNSEIASALVGPNVPPQPAAASRYSRPIKRVNVTRIKPGNAAV